MQVLGSLSPRRETQNAFSAPGVSLTKSWLLEAFAVNQQMTDLCVCVCVRMRACAFAHASANLPSKEIKFQNNEKKYSNSHGKAKR